VRYSLEHTVIARAHKKCAIVFIAVPTPTTTNGFDDSIVDGEAIDQLEAGKMVIMNRLLFLVRLKTFRRNIQYRIISLRLSIYLRRLQHNPAAPFNILGFSVNNDAHKVSADLVHKILPVLSILLL
jgi:hypothetical protein